MTDAEAQELCRKLRQRIAQRCEKIRLESELATRIYDLRIARRQTPECLPSIERVLLAVCITLEEQAGV